MEPQTINYVDYDMFTFPSRIGETVEIKLMGFAPQNLKTTMPSECVKGSYNDRFDGLIWIDKESERANAIHKIHVDKNLSSFIVITKI